MNIFEFICESKADLSATTETWLTKNDSAVKVELCPIGYKIVDHPQTGCTGGGTALIFRLTTASQSGGWVPETSRSFHYWQPAPMAGKSRQPSNEPPRGRRKAGTHHTLIKQWKEREGQGRGDSLQGVPKLRKTLTLRKR